MRYKITAPPLGVYNCHCKDCQRSSGGTHTMSMPTRREHVVLLRGELVAFDKAADNLAAGRVDLAELELDTLNKLCGVGCEQYQDLQKALLTDTSWN